MSSASPIPAPVRRLFLVTIRWRYREPPHDHYFVRAFASGIDEYEAQAATKAATTHEALFSPTLFDVTEINPKSRPDFCDFRGIPAEGCLGKLADWLVPAGERFALWANTGRPPPSWERERIEQEISRRPETPPK